MVAITYTGTGPSTHFAGTVEVVDQNQAGNYSVIRFWTQAWNGPAGNTSSFYGGYGYQLVTSDEWGIGKMKEGNPFLPSGYAQNALRWSEYQDHVVYHDANGYLGPMEIRMTISGSHSFTGYTTLWIDRIPKKPPATSPIAVDQATTTSLRYRFSGNGDNGSPIILWRAQADDDPNFGSPITMTDPYTGTYVFTGLNPGTTYNFRSRGENAVGNGPWSSVLTGTTLPSIPPTFSVAPSLSGQSAVITFSPPGGVTGVTEYNYEYRTVAGPGSSTAGSTVTTTANVTGLTPGTMYEYRGNAEIGGYTSPWSNWYPTTQPNPNTNPGDYFAGSTLDTTDTDYAWTGTAGSSTSTATLKNVTGWRTFAQGNATSGGTGTIAQVTGGYVGTYAARITFNTDATAAGFIAGVDVTGAGVVTAASTYHGSMYVRLPGRTQRLEGGIAWYNASNTLISISWSGVASVVTASPTDWTRITVSAVAPALSVKAAPVVRDTSGTSWSLWLGGDVMLMDAAMLTLASLFPYFDGDFSDTELYLYTWDSTPNASVSARYTNSTVYVDPLLDPDCPPVPSPPLPPTIASDCIEEVGVWRRYAVQVPETEVELWSSTLPTLMLTTGSVAERQVRIRYFPNPDGVAPELVDTSVWDAELILTYIPPSTEITLDGVVQRVRASVSGGSPIMANHLLYGTNGVPATWPELRCGIGYVITLDVPTDAPSGNLGTRVLVTSRM